MTLRIENILLTVVWIALLIFVAWPLAMFLYPLYVILQPFAGIPGGLGDVIEEINGFLEKFCTWPEAVGGAIFTCSDSLPAPRDSAYTTIP